MDHQVLECNNLKLVKKKVSEGQVKYLIKIDGYQVFKRMSVSNNHFF